MELEERQDDVVKEFSMLEKDDKVYTNENLVDSWTKISSILGRDYVTW